MLVALSHEMGLLGHAPQGEQVEIAGDQLHAAQPLAGPLHIAASRNDGRGSDHFALAAQEGDQAILRLSTVGRTHLDGAVLALGHAGLHQVLKSLHGRRPRVGIGFVGAHMADQAQNRLALRVLFNQEAGGLGAGHHHRLRGQQMTDELGQRSAGIQQPLHQARASAGG